MIICSSYNFLPKMASSSTTNYFEKLIKEGLPFFHHNKLQSTLRNNYFNSASNESGKNIS